jgi:hypothetical protein
METRCKQDVSRLRTILRKLLHLFVGALLCHGVIRATAPPTPQTVSILISQDTAPYMQVANTIKSYVETNGTGLRGNIVSLGAEGDAGLGQSVLIVTVGFAATRELVSYNLKVPTLATLVPRRSFEELMRQRESLGDSRAVSAIYRDPPLPRQFRFIKAAMPEAQTVGVIIGPGTQRVSEALALAAESADLHLVLAQAGEGAK